MAGSVSLSPDASPDPFLAKPGTGPDASAFTGDEPDDSEDKKDRKSNSKESSHAAAREMKDGTDKGSKEQVLKV